MRPWKKSEVDRVLDHWLSDHTVKDIAIEEDRHPSEVHEKLKAFLMNLDGKAERYEPRSRKMRRGLALTDNERIVIRSHKKLGVPTQGTARLLCRPVGEVDPDGAEHERQHLVRLRQLAVGVNLIQAYQYAFHCHKVRLVSDQAYDDQKQEEIEYGGGSEVLLEPASKRVVDYPHFIRYLGMYLMFRKGGPFAGKAFPY